MRSVLKLVFLMIFGTFLHVAADNNLVKVDPAKLKKADTSLVKIDSAKLKKIEVFLSTMNTLQASVKMEIFHDPKLPPAQQFAGKIWLDRAKKFLRIDYGNNKILAKNGNLVIKEGNELVQEFATDDTPAGLLLRPSIKFDDDDIKVLAMKTHADMLMLALSYTSPVGDVPVTLYFKDQQVMLLLGWTIQNPDSTITQVHLNPEDTHMAIPIDASVFD